MLELYKNGITSVILRVKILDNTAAYPKGLLSLSSSSSGLIISTIANNEATATAYTQAGSTIESITTLGTFAAPTATKCRFKEVDQTNHPGVYEIQIADARFAVANARSILISLSGVSTMVQTDALLQLTNAGLEITVDTQKWLGGTIPAVNVTGVPLVDLKYTLGTLSPAAAGSVSPDWGQVVNKTTTVDLSGTTIKTTQKVDIDTIKTNPVVNGGTITFPTGATLASTTNITAATGIDVTKLLGTAWIAPGTAGTPDVNLITAVRPGIRKNTALNNFEIVMTDSTNHNPATGKTVSLTRSIDNGAFGAGTLGAVTELSNGVYYFNWGAGDLNGDIIMLRATATGCDDLFLLIRTNP